MSTPRLTVAEIVRAHLEDFLRECTTRLPQYIVFALWCIQRCRTAALGGRRYHCGYCGAESTLWHSCRHRACPQCENSASAKWMAARAEDLLPVHYFHVVFTLPHVFNELLLKNKELCLELFFAAVRKTLLTVGRNNLKAKVGFFCILHTWGQKLDLHPHIHCVVPGGGMLLDGSGWKHSSKKQRYFVSSKVLGLVFRGIFIRALKKAQRQGKLSYAGDFEALLSEACWKNWQVYCKEPFSGPRQVLKYLSRYVRKIAISDSRLISLEDGSVTFSITDYAQDSQKKSIRMRAVEFIRRFALHIPPPRFVRIRHCGFLANSVRKKNLELCRSFLGVANQAVPYAKEYAQANAVGLCPECKVGRLILLAVLDPIRSQPATDSS